MQKIMTQVAIDEAEKKKETIQVLDDPTVNKNDSGASSAPWLAINLPSWRSPQVKAGTQDKKVLDGINPIVLVAGVILLASLAIAAGFKIANQNS